MTDQLLVRCLVIVGAVMVIYGVVVLCLWFVGRKYKSKR